MYCKSNINLHPLYEVFNYVLIKHPLSSLFHVFCISKYLVDLDSELSNCSIFVVEYKITCHESIEGCSRIVLFSFVMDYNGKIFDKVITLRSYSIRPFCAGLFINNGFFFPNFLLNCVIKCIS